MKELKDFKERCPKQFEESPHLRMVYDEIVEEEKIMRLTAINPSIFYFMPTIFLFISTYIVWGQVQMIVGMWGLWLVFLSSYHIGTFSIRCRESDNVTKK